MKSNRSSSSKYFGMGTGRVKKSTEQALNTIAQKHNAEFVAATMPEGFRYWFQTSNLGMPHDQRTVKAVLSEAKKAGLWPIAQQRARAAKA